MNKKIVRYNKSIKASSVPFSRDRQYELMDVIDEYGAGGEQLADFLCNYFSSDDICEALEYYLKVYLDLTPGEDF